MSYFSVLVAISFIVAVVMPLPSFIIDLILVILIGISFLIYMRATTIDSWYEMKSFPAILLLLGMFRISVNVSTTRKILTDGEPGMVIEQFGDFVIGGNLLVGAVIFIIMIIFQFIVANGASRTAEVAARFAVDSLPGKQMSIDADLQGRHITEEEARERRKMLGMEADFYGSMDGAGKFIKGDVMFGIAIVFVNIIFGLISGVAVQGMAFSEAFVRYTQLTIGDGLVSQIGSLLLALASGLVITRVYDGSGKNLTEGIFAELMKNGVVVYALGGLFIAMGTLTPLPMVPFVLIGGLAIFLGFRHQGKIRFEKEEAVRKEIEDMEKVETEDDDEVEEQLGVYQENNPILIEVGVDLIPLITQKKDGVTVKDKIRLMRKELLKDIGLKVPAVSIQDNTSLNPKGKYVIKIKGTKVAEGVLKADHLLALKTPNVMMDLDAEPAKDPIWGTAEGYWIGEDKVREARIENYQILQPLGILITHLDYAIRQNLHGLIERQRVKELIDTLEEKNPVLLEEIKEKNINLSVIQNVIQQLLKESVSIKDLSSIVEGIIDGSQLYQQIDEIVNYVREKLKKQICEAAKSSDDKVHAIVLNERIEMETETYINGHNGLFLNWEPQLEAEIVTKVSNAVHNAKITGTNPIVLVRRQDLRSGLVKVLSRYRIDVQVLSVSELDPEAEVVQVVL